MSNAYNIINDSFKEKKRDISFSPSLLDELSDDQRREVELKLIKLCLNGDSISFQYINKFKFFDVMTTFNDETMEKLKPYDKAKIYKIIYGMTNDRNLLKKIIDIAKEDANTYSMLSFMYVDSQQKDIFLYDELKRLSSISELYNSIFTIRCSRPENESSFTNNVKI